MNKNPLTWKQAKILALTAFILFGIFWAAYGRQFSAALATNLSSISISLSDSVTYPTPPGWPGWDQTPVRNSDKSDLSLVEQASCRNNLRNWYNYAKDLFQKAGGNTGSASYAEMETDILRAIDYNQMTVSDLRLAMSNQMYTAEGVELTTSIDTILQSSYNVVPRAVQPWLESLIKVAATGG